MRAVGVRALRMQDRTMGLAEIEMDGLAEVPLVDEALRQGLKAALGPAAEMIVTKAGQVLDDRLARLRGLAPTPLADEFRRLAHEIGGVAGQIGLARLARTALALERISRAGDGPAAAAALAELERTAQATLARADAA
jgi:HPt (histidine-containing phosphotransfer) domain-containing protein